MSENIIDNSGASTQEPNIIDDITGAASQEPNGKKEEAFNIDAMFGSKEDTPPAGNDPQPSGPNENPLSSKTKMTPEDYMKELQSRADKASHQLEQLKAQNEELSGAASFVNQLYDDKEVFNAFIAEINPELVKPSNPEDYIRNSLQKEFGEEFVPNEAEENIRGSRTWLYNKRADDLYEDALKQSSKVPQTISQLREKRAKAQQEAQLKAEQEKHAMISEFKWNEADYAGFLNWANKVSTMDFAKLYQYGKTKRSQSPNAAPNLASVPGGTPLSDSAYSQELTNFFGR